jgi:hypothetical protein
MLIMSCGGNVAIVACGVNLWMSLQICVILSCIRGMLQYAITLGFGVHCKGVGSCVKLSLEECMVHIMQ